MKQEELNKKAEEAAREVYTYTFQGIDDLIGLFLAGYKLAEKDTIERAIVWWYDHLVKNFSEGVVAAICDEFRKYMEEE